MAFPAPAQIRIRNGLSVLGLTYADPTAGGLSDIADDNFAAIQASDFEIRNTSPYIFTIPMAAGGWRSLTLHYLNDATYSAALDLYVISTFRANGLAGGWGMGSWLAVVTLPTASGDGCAFSANDPSPVGGRTGASPVASLSTIVIPNLNDGWPYISLMFIASSAPSTGRFSLGIARLGA
jgi:hypothetical protein